MNRKLIIKKDSVEAVDYIENPGLGGMLEDFATGELDGVVAGEEGLELEKHGINLDLYLSGVNRTLIDNVLVTYHSSSAGDSKCIPAFILDLRGVAVETLEVACHATWYNSQPRIYVYGGDPTTKITRDSYGDIIVEDYAVEISEENLYTTFGYAASGDFDVNRLYELEGRDDVLYFFRCVSYQYRSTSRLEIHSIKVNGVELVIENTDDFTAYTCSSVPSGSRTSLPLDLSGLGQAVSSYIEWDATIPEDTTLTVETGISEDAETEPATWDEATSGQPIPSISANDDLTGKYLWVRQTLETEDETVTPTLHSLTVTVEGDTAIGVALDPEENDWEEQENGQLITNLPESMIGKYLWLKQVLETTDTSVTPTLHWLALNWNKTAMRLTKDALIVRGKFIEGGNKVKLDKYDFYAPEFKTKDVI